MTLDYSVNSALSPRKYPSSWVLVRIRTWHSGVMIEHIVIIRNMLLLPFLLAKNIRNKIWRFFKVNYWDIIHIPYSSPKIWRFELKTFFWEKINLIILCPHLQIHTKTLLNTSHYDFLPSWYHSHLFLHPPAPHCTPLYTDTYIQTEARMNLSCLKERIKIVQNVMGKKVSPF